MKKLALAVALSVASAGAFAAAPAWDFVQGSYVITDFDESDFSYEPDGFAFSASKLLTDDVFVTGEYSMQEDDILDYFFSPIFAVGVSYETSDDLSTFGFNARYNF